jgi:predicted transcriptional regulator
MAKEFPMADPEATSVFDLEPDSAFEARLDAEAEADIAAGRVVPHEKVAVWLDGLARGKRLPPPTA